MTTNNSKLLFNNITGCEECCCDDIESNKYDYISLEDAETTKLSNKLNEDDDEGESDALNQFCNRTSIRLIAGFSLLIVSVIATSSSLCHYNGYSNSGSSSYVRFESQQQIIITERDTGTLYHDIVRDVNAVIGQSDDEYITQQQQQLDNKKSSTLSMDTIRDTKAIIGQQGDDELIVHNENNDNDDNAYDGVIIVTTSNDKDNDDANQIILHRSIIHDVNEMTRHGDDEFVSIHNSHPNVESKTRTEEKIQIDTYNDIINDTANIVGKSSDDELFIDWGNQNENNNHNVVVESDDDTLTSNNDEERHPQLKTLAEKFDMYNDIVSDTANVVGQQFDDDYGTSITKNYKNEEDISIDIIDTMELQVDDKIDEEVVRHPVSKTLAEKLDIYNDIVHDTANVVGQGSNDDEFIYWGDQNSNNNNNIVELDDTIKRHRQSKTRIEKFEMYNDIIHDTTNVIGQGDDEY